MASSKVVHQSSRRPKPQKNEGLQLQTATQNQQEDRWAPLITPVSDIANGEMLVSSALQLQALICQRFRPAASINYGCRTPRDLQKCSKWYEFTVGLTGPEFMPLPCEKAVSVSLPSSSLSLFLFAGPLIRQNRFSGRQAFAFGCSLAILSPRLDSRATALVVVSHDKSLLA